MLFSRYSVLSKRCLEGGEKKKKKKRPEKPKLPIPVGFKHQPRAFQTALVPEGYAGGRDGPCKMPKGRIIVLETGDKGAI